jgi:flagellar motility protein MotE (MotC chaperone)
MLGITVADAVAVGTLIIALLAAWRGARAGDAAKRISPPETTVSVGATVFADTAAMTQLNTSINRLADAIGDASEARERQQANQLSDVLRKLTATLEALEHRKTNSN